MSRAVVLMPLPTAVAMVTVTAEAAGRHIGLFNFSKRLYLDVNNVWPPYRLFHAFNRFISSVYQAARVTISVKHSPN